MKTYLPLFSQPTHGRYAFIAMAMLFLSGCATQIPVVEEEPAEQVYKTTPEADQHIPVVRYGRYTLVEVDTANSRQDVLQQIVDVTIPISSQKETTSVADAMRYLLLNSGYQLCFSDETRIFNAFPLPLVHQRLGPITLQDALLVLAGPGWQMQIDHFNRQICFTPEAEIPVSAEAEPLLKEISE